MDFGGCFKLSNAAESILDALTFRLRMTKEDSHHELEGMEEIEIRTGSFSLFEIEYSWRSLYFQSIV